MNRLVLPLTLSVLLVACGQPSAVTSPDPTVQAQATQIAAQQQQIAALQTAAGQPSVTPIPPPAPTRTSLPTSAPQTPAPATNIEPSLQKPKPGEAPPHPIIGKWQRVGGGSDSLEVLGNGKLIARDASHSEPGTYKILDAARLQLEIEDQSLVVPFKITGDRLVMTYTSAKTYEYQRVTANQSSLSPQDFYRDLLGTPFFDDELPKGFTSQGNFAGDVDSTAKGFHVIGQVIGLVGRPSDGRTALIYYIVFPTASDAKGAYDVYNVYVSGTQQPTPYIAADFPYPAMVRQQTLSNGLPVRLTNEGSVLINGPTIVSWNVLVDNVLIWTVQGEAKTPGGPIAPELARVAVAHAKVVRGR